MGKREDLEKIETAIREELVRQSNEPMGGYYEPMWDTIDGNIDVTALAKVVRKVL